MSRFRHVAPAGTPIPLGALGAWGGRLLRGGDHVEALADAVRARFGLAACVPTATGRAGLVLILRALARLAPRSRVEVVIPSYTCYTVAASVVVAGLQPRVVDIDPETLDFAPAALEGVDFTRVLAIVPTNLFGLPNNLPYLSALAGRHDVRLVDDAAQSMGASIDGRWSGTWGDAGLFSLDKGKNITAIEGGLAITANSSVAEALRTEALALTAPAASAVGRDALKLLAYTVMLRPRLYWIPNSLPQLGLGGTRYTPDIPAQRYNNTLAAMAVVMLGRLNALNDGRRAIADRLTDNLTEVAGLTVMRVAPSAKAVYLRYPVLARDGAHRDALVAALNAHGIGATGSYPTSIVDIPELAATMAPFRESAPNGRAVAARILTLPTHAYVRPADVAAIGEIVRHHADAPASPRARRQGTLQ